MYVCTPYVYSVLDWHCRHGKAWARKEAVAVAGCRLAIRKKSG